ncbi:hypothetical protein C2G38_2208176 [Gigaspora rosea]|uniref:HTH psq-type domain-containing protein n=1 Tax=Gigaspora rosea TaxID=44941 RepID=A0A397UHJ0_9GLOM|nr:hypothetical protein C2G38_2208176 [Gigaspora rosea]
MPSVSYINRRNTICEALDEINKYPSNSRPSINSIAKSFEIPEASLRYAIKNGNPSNRTGLLTIYRRSHPFNNNGPGHDWWVRFMRDHPELLFCTLQELSEARAQKANATIVKDYFEKLGKIINKNSLTAAQIWNMDETSFILIPKSEKVIAKKGVRAIPGLLDCAPPETVIGFTDTGTTGIWLFNPSVISIDHLDPSLLTEQFNEPINPPLISPLLAQPNHLCFTHLNVSSLNEENIILKNENDLLRSQVEKLSEELETYKSPSTCALRLALKYPVPQAQTQLTPDHTKKSWHQLNELNEEVE